MKKRMRRVIVGLAAILLLIGSCVATYKSSVQIGLSSGMIRTLKKTIGITFYKSSPQQTTISRALGDSTRSDRWLTIAEEGFSLPRSRIDFCYPRFLFWVGAIDRGFNNPRLSRLTADISLAELEKSGKPCELTAHMERFWSSLGDRYDESWTDSMVESEFSLIWKQTATHP